MITPITATFPALNFPKEADYPTQEDWAAFSAAAELNYGILSGTWSDKSEEFKAQTNNLALEIQEIGENAFNAISLDTIEDLATYTGTGLVIVKDLNRGGTFIYDATQSAINNGGTIFNGWVRQYSGAVNVKWFGAKGDGVTDDTAAIQSAINASYKVLLIDGIFVASSINITKDTFIKGINSTLIQKSNMSNISLIKSLNDVDTIIEDLIIDGNSENQPLQGVSVLYGFGLVWNSIGSLKMYRCRIGNTKGHAIVIGNSLNVASFDSTKFAHDCIIDNCLIIQKVNSSGINLSGDCLRVERTHNAIITNNTTFGGYSGIRTQTYNKELTIKNNNCSHVYPDVGITLAMAENSEVSNNICSFNHNHGFEIDCTVNSKVLNNISENNTKTGFSISELGASIFPDEPRYTGSISDVDYEGYNYSNQVHTSSYVPNYNLVVTGNISRDNKVADRIIGDIGTLYSDNVISNSTSQNIHCLSIEGGTISKTSARIVGNTFYTFPNTLYCIGVSSYQFDAVSFDNKIIGNRCKMSQYAIYGNYDYNYPNKYLLNPSQRSTLLVDSADSTSITGSAVTYTTSGSTLFPFSGIRGDGTSRKLMRIVMRASSNTTVRVGLELYDKSGTYVATLYPETDRDITTEYQSYYFIIDSSVALGSELRPRVRVPTSGITIYFNELNIYGTTL